MNVTVLIELFIKCISGDIVYLKRCNLRYNVVARMDHIEIVEGLIFNKRYINHFVSCIENRYPFHLVRLIIQCSDQFFIRSFNIRLSEQKSIYNLNDMMTSAIDDDMEGAMTLTS